LVNARVFVPARAAGAISSAVAIVVHAVALLVYTGVDGWVVVVTIGSDAARAGAITVFIEIDAVTDAGSTIPTIPIEAGALVVLRVGQYATARDRVGHRAGVGFAAIFHATGAAFGKEDKTVGALLAVFSFVSGVTDARDLTAAVVAFTMVAAGIGAVTHIDFGSRPASARSVGASFAFGRIPGLTTGGSLACIGSLLAEFVATEVTCKRTANYGQRRKKPDNIRKKPLFHSASLNICSLYNALS
jgi:hypothetical protein